MQLGKMLFNGQLQQNKPHRGGSLSFLMWIQSNVRIQSSQRSGSRLPWWQRPSVRLPDHTGPSASTGHLHRDQPARNSLRTDQRLFSMLKIHPGLGEALSLQTCRMCLYRAGTATRPGAWGTSPRATGERGSRW